eukprot:c11129_g1_i1.p1 GENE.c11129_g1_i1~~c11129_g1_i1.p1  ORF type:complete len:391 (+),score=-74.25 c11129_g1_i1:606-1778(+)
MSYTRFILYNYTNDIIYAELPCKKSEYFQQLDPRTYTTPYEKRLNKKFISFDIETYVDSTGHLIPYAVGSRVGGDGNYSRSKDLKLYFLLDFPGQTMRDKATAMLFQSIKDLLVIANKGYVIYCHNLGAFDGFLLIDYLKNLEQLKIKPLFRSGSIYSLDIQYQDTDLEATRLIFHDSYKLLPMSLAALAKSFNCSTQKTSFPYDFITEQTLTYDGPIPKSTHVDDPTQTTWNTKQEVFKYLANDLDCLYDILSAYDKKLSQCYGLDFTMYLSQPSISMAVFRAQYLKDEYKIPITRGQVDKYIRSAYKGGHVEVYKPCVTDGYYYDVNSLYPACLLNDMPIGDSIYIYKPKLSTFFGYIKAKVTCPDNIDKPFLGLKDETGKLIYPTGT